MKKDKNTRRAIVAAVVAVAVVFALNARRAHTYRKVIYDYQGIEDARSGSEADSLWADIERKVGRANTPWVKLPRAPRYRHFWDEYNTYGIITLNNLTYGYDNED